MTGRKTVVSLALALVGALAGCTSYFEVPIETPIQPKLDIAGFQRVLVAGFVAGGDDEVDANLETVRLLRSQLRQKGSLRVIEAEALPLTDIAAQQNGGPPPTASPSDTATTQEPGLPPIKEEKDLEAYEKIFSNVEYLEKDRRGTSESPDCHRLGPVPAAYDVRLRAARAGNLRFVRAPPRRAAARVHGTSGIHPAADLRLHRWQDR